MNTNIKFVGSNNLALSIQQVSAKKQEPVVLPVEHIAVIDVSGSMYGSLPELRKHLKNKLPAIVGENDTISLIWFSGNNQFGVLQEGVKVRGLSDLSTLNNAIDRFLQAQCLTGFVQPLEEVINVIGRLKASRKDSLVNLLFMTDGYENQNSEKKVMDVSEKLSEYVDASTIIEYGWNCNRPLLTKMASAIGANHIFSEDMQSYQTSFEREITKSIGGGKKIAVKLNHPANYGYAFMVTQNGDLITYSVNSNNEVIVPESVEKIAFFTNNVNADSMLTSAEFDVVYAGLATLSQRMLSNEIFDVLGTMGDVAFINKFCNSFSKQDYSDFQSMCLNPAARFSEGINHHALPKEDAYTVIDLLNLLSSDSGNLIYPLDPSFGYKRIGAGEKKDENSLKFVPNEDNPGVPMNCIVYNADRPNASLQTRMNGTVALPEERKQFPTLPAAVPSFIYRNYTIIRDGIVHTRKLPVSLTQATIDALVKEGVISNAVAGEKFVLDISKLPVINRKMVKTVYAHETFEKVFRLELLAADQKVYKYFRDAVIEKKSEGFGILFGEEAATWLKEIGITDYNGFNPKSTKEVGTDVYMSKELTISVAKLSSLPKVEDVMKKMEDGKKALTLRESIMAPAIAECLANKETMDAAEFQKWIATMANDAIKLTRKLNLDISRTKFAIVVGHAWFNDLSPDQNSLDISVDGFDVTVTAELKEKEIAV